MVNPPVRAISERELLENLAWVQALARGLVSDPGRADDVAQDAWVRALEGPPRGSTGRTLRAWLARVVRSKARQSLLAESRRRRREFAAAREEAQPSASDVVARTALQKRVIEAVLSLDEPERTTVLLHYVDGLSSRAIAERREEKPEAVRKRLSRAQARLRARLEGEFGAEGKSWIHALVPLAFGGGVNTAKVALGGALVTKTSWTVGVAAAVVALMVAGWYFLGGARPSVGDAAGGTEAAALPRVEVEAEGDEAPSPEFAAVGEEEPARVALAAESSPSGTVYVLMDPQQRAVEAAELVLCREGSVLARGKTDAEGRFATELEEEGAAKLLAIAKGWPAQVHEVLLAPEVQEVSLHEGCVLSGWIVVDGGRPAERIPFFIASDGVLLDFVKELGVSADALGVSRSLWQLIWARAAEDGSFRFDGLPLGWSGSLYLPHDYWLTDATQNQNEVGPWRMQLAGAAENLRIEVTKVPVLKGRVVDLREGIFTPVPEVTVIAVLKYEKPRKGIGYLPQTITDPDGEFRLALQDTSVRGGHLEFHTRDISRRMELEPREVRGDWDLGNVPLVDPENALTVRLRVLDAQGSPISGAVAGIDNTSPTSAPTDAEGRTELRGVIPGGPPIVVYAVGYQAAKTDVPEEVSEELLVDMEKCAGLELRLLTADEKPAKGIHAELRASRLPIREGERFPASISALDAAGCSMYEWEPVNRESGNLLVRASHEWRLIANDLEPGLPLHLRVVALAGEVLKEQDIAPLASGEWRVLDVDLPEGPRELHGRVLDQAGNPPTRLAWVGATASSKEIGDTRSGASTHPAADGSFTIGGLYTSTICLVIRAQGFATLLLEDYQLPVDDAPVEFRLASGHEVLVRVADPEGHPVPARVMARLQGESPFSYIRATESAPGTYLLQDLPAEEVGILARVHGVSYERRHDPLVPELTVEVPALGALEVTIRDAEQLGLDATSCHLWLLPRGDASLVRRYGTLDPSGKKPVRLPNVLPGDYQAVLRRRIRRDVEPGRWFEEVPDDQFDELTPRVPVTIRAAETARIVLGR